MRGKKTQPTVNRDQQKILVKRKIWSRFWILDAGPGKDKDIDKPPVDDEQIGR